MAPQVTSLRAAAPRAPVPSPRRIRVCHVMSADLWAGAEVQVATVASYLVERPEVDVRAVLLNEGPLARELRRLRVPVTVIDERRHRGVRILLSLFRLLRNDPVEIVHTHRYKDTVLGALAARLAGVPAVVRTVHGRSEPMRGWARARFRAYEALERMALGCLADRIIAVSGSVAEGMRSVCRPGAVVRIHNGVDLARVRPARDRAEVRRELGVDPGCPLIGTVGRLSAVKGHEHFLRAARLILPRAKEARFLLVGAGPLREELEASARRMGIARACLFLGARTDVYDLVAAMDVFVLPSLDEGIPMALLEAMALGRPVVATAVGGIPEVVTHGATGLLVRAGDGGALAEACLGLALEPRWAERLGARGRRAVEEAFSHEGSGRALLEVYREVAARPAREAGGPVRRPAPAVRRPAPPPLQPTLRVVPRSGEGAGPGPAPGGRLSAWGLVRGLIAHGLGRLRLGAARLREGRRMGRIRRDPGPLVAALRSARSILIVCHGNVIRSPFAARLLGQALGEGGQVSVGSAGLAPRPGTPSPPAAVAVAAARGVELRDHAASPLTTEAVAASDLIFVMEIRQLAEVRRRFPEASEKAFLLTCLAPETPLEVRDPVDREQPVFEDCYEHIARSVRPIRRLLVESGVAR